MPFPTVVGFHSTATRSLTRDKHSHSASHCLTRVATTRMGVSLHAEYIRVDG